MPAKEVAETVASGGSKLAVAFGLFGAFCFVILLWVIWELYKAGKVELIARERRDNFALVEGSGEDIDDVSDDDEDA